MKTLNAAELLAALGHASRLAMFLRPVPAVRQVPGLC